MRASQRNSGKRPLASWATYRNSIGDRAGLFAAVRSKWHPEKALYPGSYLDLSPSTAIPSLTYVDTDGRAALYFADEVLVATELQGHTLPGAGNEIAFLHMDYTEPLPLLPGSFDLVISLFAGPVWDHCRQYLSPDGLLLANSSHGDASIAALDPTLRLAAAVHQRGGLYHLDTENLAGYLIPKKQEAADPEAIRRKGRGIAYTRSAFAYVFEAAGNQP